MTCMATVPTPKRGEIWMIDFDPSVGAEIQKIRPAVVISVDTVGKLPLRMVVPVTDWKPQYANYPWFVELPATPGPNPPNRISDTGPVEKPGERARETRAGAAAGA